MQENTNEVDNTSKDVSNQETQQETVESNTESRDAVSIVEEAKTVEALVVKEEVVLEPIEVGNGLKEKISQPLPASVLQVNNSYDGIRETVQALDSMKQLAGILIKSNLCPLRKEEDVILAIITGNQYGLPYMTSINNIVAINNKPALSAHLHRALIIKSGISFNKIYDNEPLYNFFQVNDKGEFIKIPKKDDTSKTVPIRVAIGTIYDKIPNAVYFGEAVDRITKYEFKRKVRQADGTYSELKVTSEFKVSDAKAAGLLDKDVWAKYLSNMLDARAFTKGAREVGSDILLGIYSISELGDEFGLKYTINSSLEESLVEN